MSWPYSPQECPRCRFLASFETPQRDDAGYEIVGFCRSPRIGMDLFVFKRRDADLMEPCPCFRPARRA